MKNYLYLGGVPNRLTYSTSEVLFPLGLSWKAKIGKPIGNPIIGTGKIIFPIPTVQDLGKTSLIALDIEKGRVLWEVSPEGSKFIQENVCLYDELVFFSDGENVLAVDSDKGEILWSLKPEVLKGGVRWSGDGVLVHEEKLYVNGWHGIDTIDLKTKSVIWSYKLNHVRIPSIFNDKIVFADLPREGGGGHLFCIQTETGNLIWEKDLGKIGEYHDEVQSRLKGREVIIPGEFASRFPVITDGKIYGAVGRNMCCFDLETGELIWKSEGGGTPLHKDGRLYSFKTPLYLLCHDAHTGEIIYKKEFSEAASFSISLPFLSGNTFFVGTETGLYAFNTNTGAKVWEFHSKRKTAPFRSQPVFIDGRLYVGCGDGYMYCFKSEKEG